MYGLWGYLLKVKALVLINTRRVLEGGTLTLMNHPPSRGFQEGATLNLFTCAIGSLYTRA